VCVYYYFFVLICNYYYNFCLFVCLFVIVFVIVIVFFVNVLFCGIRILTLPGTRSGSPRSVCGTSA